MTEEIIDHFVMVKNKYPILRLWEIPSFHDNVSWTIFVDRSKQKYAHPMVRRIIGGQLSSYSLQDMWTDEAAGDKPIKVQDYHLKQEEFVRLDLFRQFTFSPIFENKMLYLDGTTFGFQTWTYPTSLLLEWWEDQPEAWQELIEWAAQTRQFLSQLIDNQEKAFKDINQQFTAETKIWRRLT